MEIIEIKLLNEDNWMGTIKIANATVYCVNEKVAWKASKNQRKYGLFLAIVVASETEQEKDFFNKNKGKLRTVPYIESNQIPIVGN